ncbi:hypothetical protein GR925_37550 [Streptomyces sp. HUCO-GS316]|uniref:hypothetical protein n=1 Tax=Streptomyces sp. HUCO-GS316 TaxID=2692198 RepID=UPI00136B8142|nr:hypothetical protein [Streptomyces sp. HUCO-GS316]MXM68949.1 hypothetical protein [Streptomyces sp. HUCO-GS316]
MTTTTVSSFDPGEHEALRRRVEEMLKDEHQRRQLERFVHTPSSTDKSQVGDCSDCTKHREAVIRIKNRTITTTQSLLGGSATGLGGTGVWLLVNDQPLQASAAGVLAGLAVTAAKTLSKLRPKPWN